MHARAGVYGAVGYVSNFHGSEEHPIAIIADGEVVIDARGSGSATLAVVATTIA